MVIWGLSSCHHTSPLLFEENGINAPSIILQSNGKKIPGFYCQKEKAEQ